MEGKVVILGGGVAALGATYHLVKHGTHPVIIERSREIGGLASSYRIGDFYIERFYHHFFPTDTLVFDLAKELGIENKMLWKKTRMGFYHKDKLYGFTSPLDIIRFMPLSFANRVRFGLTMLKIAKTREFGNLEGISRVCLWPPPRKGGVAGKEHQRGEARLHGERLPRPHRCNV